MKHLASHSFFNSSDRSESSAVKRTGCFSREFGFLKDLILASSTHIPVPVLEEYDVLSFTGMRCIHIHVGKHSQVLTGRKKEKVNPLLRLSY